MDDVGDVGDVGDMGAVGAVIDRTGSSVSPQGAGDSQPVPATLGVPAEGHPGGMQHPMGAAPEFALWSPQLTLSPTGGGWWEVNLRGRGVPTLLPMPPPDVRACGGCGAQGRVGGAVLG